MSEQFLDPRFHSDAPLRPVPFVPELLAELASNTFSNWNNFAANPTNGAKPNFLEFGTPFDGMEYGNRAQDILNMNAAQPQLAEQTLLLIKLFQSLPPELKQEALRSLLAYLQAESQSLEPASDGEPPEPQWPSLPPNYPAIPHGSSGGRRGHYHRSRHHSDHANHGQRHTGQEHPIPISRGREIGDPNHFFMTQFRSKWNPHGPAYSHDCAPTSLAMALKHFGVLPKDINPNDRGDNERLIKEVRGAMTGQPNSSDGCSLKEVAHGAAKLGLHSDMIHGMSQLDAALSQGKMVVADGNPGAPGSYGNRFSNASYSHFNGAHAILVVGRTANGGYVINDPLSRTGARSITRSEMEHFLNANGAPSGVAVWP